MFSFFKKKPPPVPALATHVANPAPLKPEQSMIGSALGTPLDIEAIVASAQLAPERQRWLDKLSSGLRKTGSSISSVFTGTQIDDALYDNLESALLMADTGVKAT